MDPALQELKASQTDEAAAAAQAAEAQAAAEAQKKAKRQKKMKQVANDVPDTGTLDTAALLKRKKDRNL